VTSKAEFQPDWASSPGETIADILEECGLSLVAFAKSMRYTPSEATDLLQGRSTVTIAVARRLEQALGASVAFWMSRDFQYREDSMKLHADEQDWLAELPVGDMVKFGWLTPVPHPSEEVAACLRFFDIPTVRAWRRTYARVQDVVAFKTSPTLDSRPAAVAAWLRQGEIAAGAIECGTWDARRFRESLAEIRSQTREKNPKRFIPALRARCAKHGVAVAVVRAPSGCRASGATRFLSIDKALLLLSFRYLTHDHFWFAFFHEAGHLLLHGRQRLFLEDTGAPPTAEEHEANEFAANILIPTEFHSALLSLPFNSREVIGFARHVGVAPGIVVGQLQHRKKLGQNQLNGLKRRFTWDSQAMANRGMV